jgi:hypothetical protein
MQGTTKDTKYTKERQEKLRPGFCAPLFLYFPFLFLPPFRVLRVFRGSSSSGYADTHARPQTPPLVFAVTADAVMIGMTLISVGVVVTVQV